MYTQHSCDKIPNKVFVDFNDYYQTWRVSSDDVYMSQVKYCPYCGEKLVAPTE